MKMGLGFVSILERVQRIYLDVVETSPERPEKLQIPEAPNTELLGLITKANYVPV